MSAVAAFASLPASQPVAPGLVTVTLPAFLTAQFREADATVTRLCAPGRNLTPAEDAEIDAADEARTSARNALRAMASSWGCNPDHLAEALS